MKRIISVLLTLTVLLALTACSTSGDSYTQQSTTAAPDSSASETAAEPESTEDANSVLVAYFPWSGNTRELAQMIQQEVDGDIYEITTATPYTDDYDELLDLAQTELKEAARPEISGEVENWDSYDTVFIGYPNWWNDAPMAVLSFLEKYDFTGKKLIPFCTHGSSGFGRSVDSVTASAKGADVLNGFEIAGSSVSSATRGVATWIAGLDIGK